MRDEALVSSRSNCQAAVLFIPHPSSFTLPPPPALGTLDQEAVAMNIVRCTLIDHTGGISFVADAEALPALVRGCQHDPTTAEELLRFAESYYRGLEERVLNGLAMFDERNVPGQYDAIRQALAFCAPHEQPPFRVVDEQTREASLQPVKAGAVLFNLVRRRIVQIQNTYREITRTGRGRIYDGERLTRRVYDYRLPKEWELVP